MGAQLDAGGGKGKKKSASPDINVTPLVDVCLVLLIIFMVATPEMDKNAQVDLPAVDTPDKKSQAKKNPLEVTISAKGEVTVAKKPYNLEDLEALLRKEKEADPEKRVSLRADKSLEFAKVREVLLVVQKVQFMGTAFAVKTGANAKDE